ncbi:MAG: hypothetical protein GY853_03480 [PVC group bacterium]|nr:hypothetical protein [PVC group bacterium]
MTNNKLCATVQIMLDLKVKNRINSALNFQEYDRVPVCDFLHNKKIFYYFSHQHHPTIEDKVKAYHGLGIDICWRFERRQTHRFDKFWHALKKYTVRQHRFHVLNNEELQTEVVDFKEQQKLFEPHTYLAMSVEGCLSVAYRSLGLKNFCERMYVEPIEIERLIEIFAENLYIRASEFARQELGNIFFITDDIAYEKGLIFSTSFLQRNWLPRIKNAIAPLKEKNIKVILHSDGNISDILEDLIDAGIDGIHPVDSISGMDIGILKKTYAKGLLLFGNVVFTGQDEKGIIEQTQKCIKSASYSGGHFIGSRAGIYDNIEFATVFAFFNAINDFGHYSSEK